MPWELIAALLALLSAFAAAAGLSHPAPPQSFFGVGSPGIPAALQARRQHARWIFLSMLCSAVAAAIIFALAVTRAASG